jgi:hypothetical protein
MALSITELELQATEYLPAREVMTAVGYKPGGGDEQDVEPHDAHTVDGSDGNKFDGGLLNGATVQDVLTDFQLRDVQVGLVNVALHDIQDLLDVATANDDQQSIVSGN